MTDDLQARYDRMHRHQLHAAREAVLDCYPELAPDQRERLHASAERLRTDEWQAVVRAAAAATRGDWDDTIFGAAPKPDPFALPVLWGRGGEA